MENYFTSKRTVKKCKLDENGQLVCKTSVVTSKRYPDGRVEEETNSYDQVEDANSAVPVFESPSVNFSEFFRGFDNFFGDFFSNPNPSKSFGFFMDEDDPFEIRKQRKFKGEQDKWSNYPVNEV